MPNKNMYIDESTHTKAFKALFGDGQLDFAQVLAADERLKAAGIFYAEEIEPRKLGPRTKAEEAADASQASQPTNQTVTVGEYDPSLPVTPDAQ